MLSKMLFYRGMSIFLLSMLVVGCNQGDERLAEKARIEGKEQAIAELQAQLNAKDQLIEQARAEGKAQAEAQLATQNGNLAEKAQKMEEDLSSRHLFYQAARGTYEGTLTTERGEFNVRITLIPSLPPYKGNRVRQLEEIASDLNNLYFNAQVVQWNPANRLSSVGCRVENLRPDINRGEISIAATSCPNLYQLTIADGEIERTTLTSSSGKTDVRALARAVSTSVRKGRITEVSEIRGEVHPTTNAAIYNLTAKRVSR